MTPLPIEPAATAHRALRTKAAEDLVGVLSPLTCEHLGPALTCPESDALSAFLVVWGAPDAALRLRVSHAREDEQGDSHWVPPDPHAFPRSLRRRRS